jgi:hypothetical protein
VIGARRRDIQRVACGGCHRTVAGDSTSVGGVPVVAAPAASGSGLLAAGGTGGRRREETLAL